MSQPGIEPGPPRWEASTLEKSHSKSLLIAFGTSTYEHAKSGNARDCKLKNYMEPEFGFAAPWSRIRQKYFRLRNTCQMTVLAGILRGP